LFTFRQVAKSSNCRSLVNSTPSALQTWTTTASSHNFRTMASFNQAVIIPESQDSEMAVKIKEQLDDYAKLLERRVGDYSKRLEKRINDFVKRWTYRSDDDEEPFEKRVGKSEME
jgi:hypothetical protein